MKLPPQPASCYTPRGARQAGAAARHSQSARVHTDISPKSLFFTFFELILSNLLAGPQKMYYGSIRLIPYVEKKLWYRFWGDLGPLKKSELSRLNPDF